MPIFRTVPGAKLRHPLPEGRFRDADFPQGHLTVVPAGLPAAQAREEVQVLERRQPAVERRRVREIGGPGLGPQGLARHVHAVDPGLAGRGLGEAQEQVDGGRLAGALGAQQAVDLAGLDPQVEGVEGQPAVGIPLAQVDGIDHGSPREKTKRETAASAAVSSAKALRASRASAKPWRRDVSWKSKCGRPPVLIGRFDR